MLLAVTLMSGLICQSLLFSAIIPALPAIAANAGTHGPLVAQLAMALPSAGLMVGGPAAGSIIDRFGLRPTMLFGLVAYLLFGGTPLFVDTPIPLVGSRFLAGAAAGLLTTTSTVLLAALYKGDERHKMIGYQVASGSASALVALVAAGKIVLRSDWHFCFLLYVVPVAILLLAAVVAVPATRAQATHGASTGSAAATIKLLWPVYVAACLLFMVPMIGGTFLPFLLTAHGIANPMTQALVIAMTTIGAVLSGAAFGRLQLKLGLRRCFAAALGIGAAGVLLMGVGPNPWISGLGTFLSGVGMGLYISYLWLAATLLPPEPLRSRALGYLSTSQFLGGFLYPLLFSPISGVLGLGGAFLAVGGLLGLAAVAVLVARRGRLVLS